ncbi:MAG: RES domain-containing protein [gamma proteobacterium endosymbiont of Lamellibrachia anaximandri]|nr:RES domain-containing protein [gamma proteobacterium endosymbiont of Lamellibrachia anaximandri]MBL3533072.1 RES domain-containing protein [gamma proteobacterium endosymbiont of Lamellibrachia anaximandri]
MLRYQGWVYRAHNPFWSFDPLSGDGAKRYGGRFNPKGVSALYTSLTETAALAEYHQGFPHRPQPATLCTYEVDCLDVTDLTNPEERGALGIDSDDLASPWEMPAGVGRVPPSWALSKRLVEDGVAGIIVPSYAKNAPENGKNLVFWVWDSVVPHKVIVIDDFHRLPKNKDSWRE